ncbi:MAG TPA: PEP-CTERM sorting domain-containing protein [Verrucomicrobiae bacterium]
MKIENILKFVVMVGLVYANGHEAAAQTAVPSTFANITIDGSFSDWAHVPLAYTAAEGSSAAIQYDNVYIANDANDLFIRVTLYSPRADAFANGLDNIFIDGDGNASTGYQVAGIGSEMLIQNGSGYQEKGGGFNEGAINNLGWSLAGSGDSLDFEFEVSLAAAYASNSALVFDGSTIAVQLEGDDTGFNNVAFAPSSGGFVYTLATAPVPEPSTAGLVCVGFGLLILTRRLIRQYQTH